MRSSVWRNATQVLREHKMLFIGQVALSLVMFVFFYNRTISSLNNEAKRRESNTYVQQVELLSNVQESLKNVNTFVELQITKLQESEDVINGLRAEQEKLKPLVETDRKTIEAILDFQMEKARSDAWKERGIGFGSGILASIIASFIYGLTRRLSRKTAAPTA